MSNKKEKIAEIELWRSTDGLPQEFRKLPKTRGQNHQMIKETLPVHTKDCEQHLFLSVKVECHIIQGSLGRIFKPTLD